MKAERILLNLEKFGMSMFAGFGRYNYTCAQDILLPHIHPDMLEICYLAKGKQQYLIDGEPYELYGGDALITRPNELHGTSQYPEDKGTLFWIILKAPEEGEEYLGLPYNEANELYIRLLNNGPRVFKCAPKCGTILNSIFEVYKHDRNPLAKTEITNLIVSFFLTIIKNKEAEKNRKISTPIIQVTEYIDKHICDTFSMEKLASLINLSESGFKHRFKKEIGMPPAEYIARTKVKRAETMLRNTSLPIAEIAYELGFSSPAYFATVFKQYSRTTPSSFRK